MFRWAASLLIVILVVFTPVYSQESDSPKLGQQALEPPMSLERMEQILLALSPEAQTDGSRFLLVVEDVQLFVFTDLESDRMRVMTPIRPYEGITCLLYTSPSPRDRG